MCCHLLLFFSQGLGRLFVSPDRDRKSDSLTVPWPSSHADLYLSRTACFSAWETWAHLPGIGTLRYSPELQYRRHGSICRALADRKQQRAVRPA